MGFWSVITQGASHASTTVEALDPGQLAAFAAPVGEPAPRPAASDQLAEMVARSKLGRIARTEAMQIPSVRRAVHTIAGTLATFTLSQWTGGRRTPVGPAWLGQPEPGRPLYATLKRTVDDLIWHDRAYWRPCDWYVSAQPRDKWRPARFGYVSAERVTPLHDLDNLDAPPVAHLVDGDRVENLVCFDGAGLGGLRFAGWTMLDLYARLFDAADNYARSPLPSVALHNTGPDLDPDEINDLLLAWETARANRSTAYLNAVVTAEKMSWSARELQLVEAREHAALETARLFGLPAFALDAAPTGGASLTYGNRVDNRRELLEALRPWITVIDQTLSMDAVTVRGTRIGLDVDAYTRDDPQTRMATWATGIAAGIITVPEARAAEPLATGDQMP